MIFVLNCRDNNSFLQEKLQTSKPILLKFEKITGVLWLQRATDFLLRLL